MEGIELISFEIIASVGTARSFYIEAIELAKENDFEGAQKSIEEGDKAFTEGHKAHMKLVTEEAQGNHVDVPLLLVHAEDQLMSAETFKILATQFIDLYKKVNL